MSIRYRRVLRVAPNALRRGCQPQWGQKRSSQLHARLAPGRGQTKGLGPVFHYHSGDPAAELDSVVRATVPGVDLAHRGEVEAGDWRPHIGDVARMVDGRNRLGVVGAPEPAFFQPA